jgi:hypothetical protein
LSFASKLAAYLGVAPPYRFERAIPAFFAIVALVVTAAAASWFAFAGELVFAGPRAAYLAYLAVLLVAVLATVRWPKVSVTLLVLALVDLCWGLASSALLPPVRSEPQRFAWHPLLQVVPIPSLKIVSSTGLAISHTSQGTRGREPAPGSLDGRIVVATYGGSTGYDIGVGEGDTWSDRLAEGLGDRYFVVNHGVPGYTTFEHLMQTAFYQDKFDRQPACAIYYVGWNDLRNAHIPNLDPGYADFHLPSQVDSLKVRRVGGSHVTISPALTMLMRILSANLDTVRYFADPYAIEPRSGDDPALIAIFERNIRSISGINRQRGVATVWVGQLVNRDRLTGDGRYGWLPLVRDRDVWPMLQKFNAVLARTAGELGDRFVDLSIGSFTAADFVDNGHFSISGARRFAAALTPAAREACH